MPQTVLDHLPQGLKNKVSIVSMETQVYKLDFTSCVIMPGLANINNVVVVPSVRCIRDGMQFGLAIIYSCFCNFVS